MEYKPHRYYPDKQMRQRFIDRYETLGGWNGIGEGWQPIVGQAAMALDTFAPGWHCGQVKEKFGTLRFYVDPPENSPDEISYVVDAIVSAAESKSCSICEWCGEIGRLDSEEYWVLTLCDHCKMERSAGKNPKRDQ